MPADVTSITLTLAGGQGSQGVPTQSGRPPAGGYQGVVSGTISVTPGEYITIGVGAGADEPLDTACTAGSDISSPADVYDAAGGRTRSPRMTVVSVDLLARTVALATAARAARRPSSSSVPRRAHRRASAPSSRVGVGVPVDPVSTALFTRPDRPLLLRRTGDPDADHLQHPCRMQLGVLLDNTIESPTPLRDVRDGGPGGNRRLYDLWWRDQRQQRRSVLQHRRARQRSRV